MRKMLILGLMAGVVLAGSAQTAEAQSQTYCFQISQWPDTFQLTLVPVGRGVFQITGEDFDPEADDVFAVTGAAIPAGGLYKLGLTTYSHMVYNRQFSVEMTVSANTGAGTARTYDNSGVSEAYKEDGTASLVSCSAFDAQMAGARAKSGSFKPRQ
jgi:hypothetical protein